MLLSTQSSDHYHLSVASFQNWHIFSWMTNQRKILLFCIDFLEKYLIRNFWKKYQKWFLHLNMILVLQRFSSFNFVERVMFISESFKVWADVDWKASFPPIDPSCWRLSRQRHFDRINLWRKRRGKSSWIGFRITFSDKASPCSTSTKFKSRNLFIAAVDKNLATLHNTVFETHR